MAHFGKDLEDLNGSRCIQIRSAEQTENFTVYVVSVTVGSYSWTVKHRYSEFFELHEKLTTCYKLDKGLLPPKKLFGNQTESFVKKRQRELEIYLQTILLYLAHHIPSCLAYFLNFDYYEIHGITQAMAEELYNRGESLLQSREKYPVTSLQLYSLTERLKLPEPTCDSGDVKKDLGHILDFITRTKHLKVMGGRAQVGTSNIVMSKLPFDLTLFKSLQTLEMSGCNFHLISGLETIKQTLIELEIHESTSSMKEMLLQDSPHWKAEDGSILVGNWDLVTHLDLSHNSLATIHPSIQLMPNVETLNLSHNEIEVIQNLHWLSQLTHVDLSHNRIRHIDSLHTKLGNVKVLVLEHNQLESLHGFAKLFSLQTLDMSHNKISAIEEMQYISNLPCLERVLMIGNNVTNSLDYRTKTLEMFGDRVAEVTLDHEKPKQKELDTVAVLQALSKAKNTKIPKKSMGRKNASAASLTDAYYSQTPTGSLSDQSDGSHIASHGQLSTSVPTPAIPWSLKEAITGGARSHSPFSQDSESSYNSTVDTDSVLTDKMEATHHQLNQTPVPTHTIPSASVLISGVSRETSPYTIKAQPSSPLPPPSSINSNNNSVPTHQLVPEAHPYDLSFEANIPPTSTSPLSSSPSFSHPSTSTANRPKQRLSNPSLTGIRKNSKSSLDNNSSSTPTFRKHSSCSIDDAKSSNPRVVTKESKESSDSDNSGSDALQQNQQEQSDSGLNQKRTWTSTYNAADLPTTSNKVFLSWLHHQLLTTDDKDAFIDMSTSSFSSSPSPTDSHQTSILDIMWCYVEQMSHPSVFIPCCIIITPTTIYLEKLIDNESGFQGVPHLQPLYIVSIKNIQQIIIGPCYCYFRLEESFVGKSGTFSVFGVDSQSVRRVVNKVISLCSKICPSNDLDCVDLSMHSDLLKQIILYEENLSGSVSDRLVLMIPIRMLDSPDFCFLILSESRVYCVGLGCTMWPPPSFQSCPNNKFCIEILHEFSILNKIVDLKIHPSGSSHYVDNGNDSDHMEFSMYQLSVNVSVSHKDWIANAISTDSKTHKCYNYLFPSSAYRDVFLDRLSNLRAEHENRTYPNVREEPEGGNEQIPTTKCQNYSSDSNLYTGDNDTQQVLTATVSHFSLSSQHHSGVATVDSPTLTSKSNTTDVVLEPETSTDTTKVTGSSSDDVLDSAVGSPNHSESNESFRSVLTDSDIYKEVIEYQGPHGNSAFYSSSPKDDLSVSPMSNFSRASISPPPDHLKSKTVNVKPGEIVQTVSDVPQQQAEGWHYEQTSAKAGSLPSSFDWKKFYFKSPLNRPETVIEHSPQGPSTVIADASDHEKSFSNRLFLDLKTAIATSGGNALPQKEHVSETGNTPQKPKVVETEHDKYLKECVQCYDLIHTLPTKLKPLCLMNGAELRKFFYATIAQSTHLEGLQEDLHYVLWASVIPYTNPKQEIVTLIMLSTYAAYLVSDTEVKVAKASRPSWMSHSRNQSDSAIAWKTERDLPGSPNRKYVKSYAVLKYKDLHQVNIGLFDQCVRLTGPNEDSVFTVATRDCQATEKLIQKLKQVLYLSVSSPLMDPKSPDIEQDFYKASRSMTNKSTSECLVYTHPSKVSFVYPGDETVQDMLYLIKEKISGSTVAAMPQTNSLSLWFYMQGYLLPSEDATAVPFTLSTAASQARSLIITPIYFCLAEEDIVTYPLPDFVRGLPENPCHDILECRHIDSLKSIQLYNSNPHWVCLTFADEKLGIVVDVSMEHFGQPQAGGGRAGGAGSGGSGRQQKKPAPQVSFKFHVQSLAERDKLVQVLDKLWKQQVSVVGRMLDIHTV